MKRDLPFTPGATDVREIRHFNLFCGLGGGAKGFNRANPRVGNMVGRFRCIGGVDVDAAAIRDFNRLAGVEGTSGTRGAPKFPSEMTPEERYFHQWFGG